MNIYEAIADIMKEGYAITKDKKNSTQGFMYRGIDDVMNTFQPLMASRGIFVVPEVLDATREERQTKSGTNMLYSVLKVRYTFYASDGSNVSAVVIGEGMDSGDKASNKALAVAMKYAMFQTFCIPTEEMKDPDAETPEPSVPVTQPAKPLPDLPKPPAKSTAKSPKFVCECCNMEIKPYADENGKPVSLRAHAERSQAKFGKILCLDCIKKQK